ncbi:MAG TPA: hypothetical protein DCL35_00190 [Candidatus Omnitrophica bacterium]|nr:hypothetical protein [Candidatus Omnitrophota bacterium]
MRRLIVLLLFLGLGGCATTIPLPDKPIENNRTFEASYDKVWTATMQVLAELTYSLRMADKNSGVIITDYVNFPGKEILRYAQYNRPFSDRFGRFKLNITIQKNDSDHIVKIISNIEAGLGLGRLSAPWVNRPSNGHLESMILSKIQSKILELR